MNKLFQSCFGRQMYKLTDFTIIKETCDDTFNKVKYGRYVYIFLHNNEKVGEMTLKHHNGQIGILWLHPDYRGMGIGQEMITMAERATNINVTELWAVTISDHPFWMRQYKAKWCEPVHKSVTGSGYRFIRQVY